MATKALRRFEQRIDSYNTDLELCDLLVRQLFAKQNSVENLAVALGGTAERYPYIGRRSNNKQSRDVCGAHLKHTLLTAFVKDVFEDFSAFIAETMTKAALKGVNPQRFVGDVKLDLSAAEILGSGSWDSAVRLVSDSIFRKLENERKTRDLIQKASVRLGLNVDNGILNDAMPYLDARHILVHRDGKADELYTRDYPGIALRNEKIVVDYNFASQTRTTVRALAQHLDELIIAADLVRPQDLSGQRG